MPYPRVAHALVALLVVSPVLAAEPTPEQAEFFEKRIRPVLAEHCLGCHSAAKIKGGLRLDSLAAALTGGDSGPALVPGEPAKSRLVEAVGYGNVDLQMPPRGKLPAAAIDDLSAWVKMGAPWAGGGTGGPPIVGGPDIKKRAATHWAWKPVRVPAPPAVRDAAWPTDPADRFVLASLEAAGLKPSPPTEKRVWLRRVTFDITGLPPTPDEIDAFLKDESPEAFAKVVDRLLASPAYGERWARHWLDLARYAESRGHEFDFNLPNAWQYRDYVVRALNADVPYDRFVREQVAGDLLPDPRRHPTDGFDESVLGTGFWLLGEEVHSPVDIRLDQADRFDNRIDVLTKTFLGLTVSCARCHDHKFDAISTRDYYALYAMLEGTGVRQARFDTDPRHRELAAKLADWRAKQGAALEKAIGARVKPTGERLAELLLAARGVNLGKSAADIVLADFEAGDYDGWEATGTAFGDRPQTKDTVARYQGEIGAKGKWFVNSHNVRKGEDVVAGDAHKGTLTSRPFTIERGYITLLVGGGSHAGKTCVNLLVDSKAVRSATGRDDNRMSPVRWDVRDLRGKTARIQIVDDVAGPWGNIGVDEIVQTDGGESTPDPKAAADAARALGVEPTLLAAWAAELGAAAKNPADPLHAFARGNVPAAPADAGGLVADFAAGEWSADVAFGRVAAGGVELLGDPAKPTLRLAERGAMAYDRAFDALRVSPESQSDVGDLGKVSRAGRTIRTQPFALSAGRVWVLMRGGAFLYAAVEGHAVIEGPLHRALTTTVQPADSWRWVSMDLSAYRGRRLALEMMATPGTDFSVARVVQADTAPALAAWKPAEKADGPEALAKAYQTALLAGDPTLTNRLLARPALLIDGPDPAKVLADVLDERAKLLVGMKWDSRLALAVTDLGPVEGRVFVRGSHKNLGEPTPPRFLEALGGERLEGGSGRLALARRLTDPANPFAGRVIVNRVWHHLFGRGIVASVDNFGVLGEAPSHPELLDHLADRFVKDGWSVKRLIRELVLSATYRQDSRPVESATKADPANRLWHRMPVRRLEGEAIRDALLAVSGRLDTRPGGPSIPVHLTPFLSGRGRPADGPVDGAGRRSLYTAVRRNFLSPFLLAYDTPIPFSSVGRRQVSNVPAQALILLNDPFVQQQAELWAKRELTGGGTDDERIGRMYLRAYGRSATPDELAACREFVRETAGRRGMKPTDPVVWADLAHTLFNVKEFIFVR